MTERHKELHQHKGGSITQLLHQSAATKNDVCRTTVLFPQCCCTSRVEDFWHGAGPLFFCSTVLFPAPAYAMLSSLCAGSCCTLSRADIPLCVSILQSSPGSNPAENKVFFWANLNMAPSSSVHTVPAWPRGLHTGEGGGSPGQRFVLADYRVNMTWSFQTNLVYAAITILQN